MSTAQRIVITGGTGFVGRAVCERLVAQLPGVRLVVPTRRLAAARSILTLPGVEPVVADVHNPAQAAALLTGADALVHLVAILHGSATAFERVHVQLPQTLAAAARAAGVRRVVHVSALGVAADAPSAYLRSKAAGEAVWRASGLATTVLRPSVIFGRDDQFTNLFAQLLRLFPVMPLAGADARFQPVAVGDVAQAVVSSLLQADRVGAGVGAASTPLATIECAGPEVLTLRQIVQRIGQLAGCARPVIALPEAAGMLQAALLGLLPGQPLMSRDNLLSMRVPNVATSTLPGLASLGITPVGLDSLASHFNPRPAYQP